MDTGNYPSSLSDVERQAIEDSEAIATNVERYLNNHTREGGHAWQMNMAARRQEWHPLQAEAEHARSAEL